MKNYFTPKEFRCRCGCGGGIEQMDKEFLIQLNKVRDIAGIPITLNSAYRCWAHNATVGSSSDNHPKGVAVDARCLTSNTRYKIIKAALKAGITRIGVHKTFIHLDTNPSGVAEVIWVY